MGLSERDYMRNRRHGPGDGGWEIGKGLAYVAGIAAIVFATLWFYRQTRVRIDLHTAGSRLAAWASHLTLQEAIPYGIAALATLYYALAGFGRWWRRIHNRFQLRRAEAANRRRWEGHRRE